VNIFLRNASGQPAVPGLFLILDRGYPFTFVGASTGRFALPESGSITFSVYGDLNGQSGSGVGPYELEVFPIDSAPEVVSRTYVVGDTISGERLDPAGDLDEYVTTLTAGDHLRFVCEAEEAGQPQWAWCVFSGAPPGVTVYGVGANRSDPATGDFVVPVTGTYHVLIDGNGATSYRFGLVRLP
jgi:hypothetical protein